MPFPRALRPGRGRTPANRLEGVGHAPLFAPPPRSGRLAGFLRGLPSALCRHHAFFHYRPSGILCGWPNQEDLREPFLPEALPQDTDVPSLVLSSCLRISSSGHMLPAAAPHTRRRHRKVRPTLPATPSQSPDTGSSLPLAHCPFRYQLPAHDEPTSGARPNTTDAFLICVPAHRPFPV